MTEDNVARGLEAVSGDAGREIKPRKLTRKEKKLYKRPSGYRKGITLYDIEMKKINYVKRDRSVLKELRNDFNKSVRKDFLKSISSDIKNLKSHGLSETDIQKLKDGLVPKGYQVHH